MQHFWIRATLIAGALVAASCKTSHEPLEKLKRQLKSYEAKNVRLTKILQHTKSSQESRYEELHTKKTRLQGQVEEFIKKEEERKTYETIHESLAKRKPPIDKATTIFTPPEVGKIFEQAYSFAVKIKTTIPAQVGNRHVGGTSTGVIITNQGHIITNAHCTNSNYNATIKVTMPTGEQYSARVLIENEDLDLALLELIGAKKNFSCITFGNSDELVAKKSRLFAVCRGRKSLIGSSGYYKKHADNKKGSNIFLLCDYPSIDGFSGGPVIDQQGNLVGISEGGASEWHGFYSFAIAANAVKEFIQKVMPDFDGR